MTPPQQDGGGTALTFADPMRIRAEMARKGLAPVQTYPYEDAEHGWVDPLADHESREVVRWFLGEIWRACLAAEDSTHARRGGDGR